MTELPLERLEKLVARWEEVQAVLSSGTLDQASFVARSREYADLDPLVAAIRSLQAAQHEAGDLTALAADPGAGSDMHELAAAELASLGPRIEALRQELRIRLLPRDAADEGSAILEVRAGTGGDEAALFAADLVRMYERYAASKGWKTEIISASESDLGGYREVIANISGKGVFAR